MSDITNDDAPVVDDSPMVDAAPRESGALKRLYRGQTRFDFVGKRKIWFTISAVIIILGIVAIGVRGLNLGIDFKGGDSWQVEASPW